jgi:hypothetical protein
MSNPGAFLVCRKLVRRKRFVSVFLLASVCLVASAYAQHGGGGGHGGGFGGHFGGGHSGGHGGRSHAGHSGNHHAGHFGWLHFGSRGRAKGGVRAANVSTPFFRGSPELGRGLAPRHPMPSTYLRTLPLSSMRSPREERFTTFRRFPHRPDYFRGEFRHFPPSGCSFNGFGQVCYFEPAWPLYGCSLGFWFPFDFGFDFGEGDGGGDADQSDTFASEDVMPATTPSDEEAPPSQPSTEAESAPAPPLRGLDLDPRFFLLILKNGTEHVVTSYWFSEGYIEYVSRDGSQSHIPIEALDLAETVRSNSARGLSFVLRSAP